MDKWGDRIRGTLTDTALFGAVFVLACDMIGRSVIAPYELPIELIVGIVGSILFIAIIFYRLKYGKKFRCIQASSDKKYESYGSREREENTVMQKNAHKTRAGLLLMAVLALGAAALYMLVNVDFENEKLFAYAMRIRAPKLFAMMITAFAIGGASLVFQSVINNTIVTPCLLGMNSLYMLIHTAVIFAAGSGSILAVNAKAAFGVDLLIMGTAATVIYSTLFRKTGHNVLYVLLIGTVLNSFFGSVQSAFTRIMDPNEYDSLLADLVASFANVNSEIMLIAALVLALVVFALRKELALLDVITLGKDQAVNLGVDYDRCIRRLLLGVALFIAVATAMVGPVSFLGLILANLSRQLLKTYRHSQLILGSVFFGIIILVGGQLIVEQVFTYTVPVSVFITFFGGIYFLYLLLTERRRRGL